MGVRRGRIDGNKPAREIVIKGLELAEACARAADTKQAEDIAILDLKGISSITDYFVICSGTSLPHLKALHREISEQLREKHGARPRTLDGDLESRWLVLDYGDVIVHVFHREMRPVYSLEDLWSDAKRVAFENTQVTNYPNTQSA
jgi:ribosome-associated protein